MQKSGDLCGYSCTNFLVCSTSDENDIFVTCVAFYHNVDHLTQQLLDFYVSDVLARVFAGYWCLRRRSKCGRGLCRKWSLTKLEKLLWPWALTAHALTISYQKLLFL